MREWRGSLVAPMVAHAVVNAVNLPLLTHLYGEQDDEVAEEEPP